MRVEPAPRIAEYYDERMDRYLAGELPFPGFTPEPRKYEDGAHCSDLQMCPLPAYYRYTWPPDTPLPTLDPRSVRQMFRGRCIEAVLSEELPTIEIVYNKIPILLTPDGRFPVDQKLIEIKSTLESHDLLHPVTSHKEWVERSMMYCYGLEEVEIYLYVYFIAGNLMNYPFWMRKQVGDKFGYKLKKGGGRGKSVNMPPYSTSETRAWKYTFTQEELGRCAKEYDGRVWRLDQAIQSGEPEKWFDMNYIRKIRPEWQCKRCRWKRDHCYFWKNLRTLEEHGRQDNKIRE